MSVRLGTKVAAIALGAMIVAGAGVVGASAGGLLPPAPSSLPDPSAYAGPPPSAVTPTPPLPPAAAAPVANAAAIDQALNSLDRSNVGTVSWSVTDLAGNQISVRDPDAGRIPASSWKLIVASAALTADGPDRRFSTTVVASDEGIVLVGGGDPYLTIRPTAQPGQGTATDLADQVAKALTEAGRTTVALGYDDSLFAGSQWHPSWMPDYAADVEPISALSIDPNGVSTSDTSQDAAAVFRDLLAGRGITVTQIRPERAAAGATVLGKVESLPLGRIVQIVISRSDNFGSEVLFRHVSVAAGGDGSFTDAARALTAYLRDHDAWTPQMFVSDGSGLSLQNKVPAAVLAAAVRAAHNNPTLADILTGLPVAAVDGTLHDRFNDPDEAAGRGVVRAKTGTQDYVRTLTGFVQTNSGAILVFSFMLNDLKDDYAGVNWLDEAASILAST